MIISKDNKVMSQKWIIYPNFNYSELFQKTGFFKEKNAGFSEKIHRVTLTKT